MIMLDFDKSDVKQMVSYLELLLEYLQDDEDPNNAMPIIGIKRLLDKF